MGGSNIATPQPKSREKTDARKRGNTAHSRRFAISNAAPCVAKRLECGAFRRFPKVAMRKITRSRRHDHPAGDGCNAARGSGTGTKLRNGLFGLYSPGEQGRFFPIRMTNYEIRYDDAAREDLDRLPRRQAGQIVKKIRRLEKG